MEQTADPWDVRLASGASGLLDDANRAGILTAADVHIAHRLGELCDESDPIVVMAAALAVRAPRLGHVCVDLRASAGTATTQDGEVLRGADLGWPTPDEWLAAVTTSDMVRVVTDERGEPDGRPLRLHGDRLYLQRCWAQERRVAADLRERSARRIQVDETVLTTMLEGLFDPADTDQRQAAVIAALSGVGVIAGGPGTGKTTTVARVLALIDDQGVIEGGRPPQIALAAPTGRAAARLAAAVGAAVGAMEIGPDARARLGGLEASTLHALLGRQPGRSRRVAHHSGNRLPHDVVVVDEASMVSLSLMSDLLDAIRPTAQLILVGDHDQLASVEAGAVLGDIVGPAADGPVMTAPVRAQVARLVGHEVPAGEAPNGVTIGDGVAVMTRTHRYSGALARLASAVADGRGTDAVAALRDDQTALTWIDADAATIGPALEPVRQLLATTGVAVTDAAWRGDASGALKALSAARLLCAHRRGAHGVTTWAERVERWVTTAVGATSPVGRHRIGQPLLVTRNDPSLHVHNGDAAVVIVGSDGLPGVAVERPDGPLVVSPARLESVESLHAMTIHKAQGSEYDAVVVVLPRPDSPLLTRELLLTAVTRARHRLIVVGTAAAITAAVDRPVARASGLRDALWGPDALTR